MSKEVAVAFLKAVQEKPDLKAQVRAEKLEENQSPENQKKLLSIASKAGYSFTIDELTAAARSVAAKRVESGELTEEDLEKVAGGVGCTHTCGFTCLWTGRV